MDLGRGPGQENRDATGASNTQTKLIPTTRANSVLFFQSIVLLFLRRNRTL